MTYNDFVLRLDSLSSIGLDVSQFPVSVPAIIEAAEQRIYRELDFLATKATASGLTTMQGNRMMPLPASPLFVTLENVAVTIAGARQFLTAVTRDLLDAVYANAAPAGPPQWFAMQDPTTILLGPWPDQAYAVDMTGTTRPAPLSAANPSTWLSVVLPDLLFAAAMAFVSTFTKTGDEAVPGGWEAYYQTLKASATVEEQRRKFQGPGWTSLSPVPAASATR